MQWLPLYLHANMDKWTAVWLCVTIAVVYAILSGFWGVVITDIVQFFIAMFGSIALAIIALNHVEWIHYCKNFLLYWELISFMKIH